MTLALLLLAACSDGGGGGTGVETTGAVAVLAWIDRNGNETLDGSDGPVSDVRIELQRRSGSSVVASARTSTTGIAILPNVPVGDYIAGVDEATLGDTLRVLRIDSASVRVRVGDTTDVQVVLSYPTMSLLESRALPAESRIFVTGLVLNAWSAFGDSTIHLRDTSGAIRLVRAPSTSVGAGDSVRVLATTSVRTGQVVLKDVAIHPLRTGTESPPPVEMTTGEAGHAGDGAADADLVRITNAVVQDVVSLGSGEYRVTVDDGTGPLVVLLDRSIGFSLPAGLVGRSIDATGLLVPDEEDSGTWVLKPRTRTDFTVLPAS